MNLDTPVSALNRVGKIVAKQLQSLGIHTTRDLLWYFPFRYEDFSQVVSIRDVMDGEQITVKGIVELIANRHSPRKRTVITEALVGDGTGRLRVVWFGQPFLTKNIHPGEEVYFSGQAARDMFGPVMVSPQYEKTRVDTTHTARIVPIYSVTRGITQKQLRFLVAQARPLAGSVEEWLPEDIRRRAGVVSLNIALRDIHFPDSQNDLKRAEQRLKFDELFLLQLRAEMIRQAIAGALAPALVFDEAAMREFVAGLPWALTAGQKMAAWDILRDIGRTQPMNRLLEGEVGSGKTVVAGMAMYQAARNSHQTALMAPTEILAKQHFVTLQALLAPHGLRVALLTRSQRLVSGAESSVENKAELFRNIAAGEVDIVVGTHALLGASVIFFRLGLVVVDEQHRFGVQQRKIISEKSGLSAGSPHFLSMTATPIPRSLALTLYGDLDLSLIRELPPGRRAIKTRFVSPHLREKAYAFIRDQVRFGRQVFVICPLIDGNQELGTRNYGGAEKKSVLAEYEKLAKHIFSDLRVGYLHGRMKAKEKEAAMKKFVDGATDILVATSVVEVGVDIPNASVMMIEGAEAFGLAQLHQFRGRVGRSQHQSYCFLFTAEVSAKAKERLEFFEKNTDGFALAEYDLSQRGPGEVYGTAQSGMMNWRLATTRDVELIKLARGLARGIDFERYPALLEKVRVWEARVHLE
ncbi:MAG: ATP-dependent DNA helicase RecG [Candidatus Magasanikbacteria bacterium]|nr:ATP-dependent DNA helicase RecG [Candidatus Magasanikbacteria bacterium]